ncbi:proline dehydrogenase family protein [Polaribacter glomeratus]|uniref:Proline dehydrogenase n=1 Tax=Polaribacter glomeratus TaxID=102 RepID=A0A2S7WWU0_9FLAO|nr:proline dehydrogenase family protein [Polaribacter glomeratus]PQJ81946.1 proline dehydrogenase [Polaribacter glomeratus]TXD64436.1 proline dehydrogenase [Polaribacter glomeratus]
MKLFDNTEVAFALKTDSQLERAYFLFRMIQNQPMVKIGSAVTNFALKVHLPIEGLVRSTVFDHFCGGVNEDDCMPIIDNMYTNGNVHSVLDYSVEGKDEEISFDGALEKILKIIDFCEAKKSIPYAVFKPTGFGRFALYEKVSAGKSLTDDEKAEWKRIVARYHKVCQVAVEKDVPLLIDGEESWMQHSADILIEELMETYNKEKAIVFNTLQMYRHDRMEYLKALHEKAIARGFHIGMKVVRGAYMEKERARAEEKGYPSPICANKEATDKNYDAATKYMIENPNMALFVGTHNEESSYLVMELAKKHNIAKDNSNLWFGQLFGMSDHISYNLANEGYNVAKYLPFGPVRDVMPYLIRRAEENTSVAGQTSRELNLLKTERKRRKL